MLIHDCMTRHPISIAPTLSATEVQRLMTENNIRHLPVVESGKRLAGLITRQHLMLKADAVGSLNVWEISRYLSDLTAAQIMLKAKDVLTISAARTVERAAAIMAENRIGCLPVVEDGNIVVGIVTETDLLRAFQEMLGLPSPGVRVTMRMPNRKGEFAKLMGVLAEHQWGVMGIGAFPSRRRPGFYDAVIKIPHVALEEVQATLSQVPDQEVVDVRTAV